MIYPSEYFLIFPGFNLLKINFFLYIMKYLRKGSFYTSRPITCCKAALKKLQKFVGLQTYSNKFSLKCEEKGKHFPFDC